MPRCGSARKGYNYTTEVRWDHLYVTQHRCRILASYLADGVIVATTLEESALLGRVRTGGFSKEFVAFALMHMREMPVKKATEVMGVTDTRLWRLLQCQVAAARKEADFSNVSCVSVDEMAIRKGHRYISVLPTLWNDGSRARLRERMRVWLNFLKELEFHKGHRRSLDEVSENMSPAHLKRVRDYCRNTEVIHNKCKVVTNLITVS